MSQPFSFGVRWWGCSFGWRCGDNGIGSGGSRAPTGCKWFLADHPQIPARSSSPSTTGPLSIGPPASTTDPIGFPLPSRRHVGQVRLHKDLEGGPVLVLPDVGTQCRHQVSSLGLFSSPVFSSSELENGLSPWLLLGPGGSGCANGFRLPQIVPHPRLSHDEEEQPHHARLAARGCGHSAQGLREIRVRPGEEPVIRRFAVCPFLLPFHTMDGLGC